MLARKALLAGIAVFGLFLVGCSGDSSAPKDGDVKNQIDTKAKPTLPPPTMSVSGAAPGGNAPAGTGGATATPQ